jgi:hypothetical protein
LRRYEEETFSSNDTTISIYLLFHLLQLILAYTVNNETVQPKSLLLFLESKNLLGILESLRVQIRCAIHRVRRRIEQQDGVVRHINPMLPGGGGRGYGLMPRDLPKLMHIQILLNHANEIMVEFKEGKLEQKSPNSVYDLPCSEPVVLELS